MTDSGKPCDHGADTALLCDFLSRLFAASPDAGLVQCCRSGAGGALLATLQKYPALRPGIERMTAALAGPRDDGAVSEWLDRAYTLLFSGVAGPETVSLYASVHICGRLFGDATARMDDVLASLGLSIVHACREPSDHLAIQLAVLAELLRRASAAEQCRFRDELLHTWLPNFCEQCCARDPSGFYAGAAMLAAACVCREQPPVACAVAA